MPRYSLGISATSYLSVWETIDTLELLERANSFGATGIQAVINNDPAKIRNRAEQLGMYVEAMLPLPLTERDLETARTAGAVALRAACLGTRRYETFKTLEAWQSHVAESHRLLAAAVPLLDNYKIPLGLENHKDWTADELVQLMQQYSSEYFGVCLDFGNNIALLDNPMEAIEKLAPYTVTTHVKDIAVAPYDEGILLSEVILGTGLIDLPRAIQLIHSSRPQTRMTLEMITREPLKIPVLSAAYGATFRDKVASDLAPTMRFVHQHKMPLNLPKAEDQNIIDCLTAWESFA